MARNLFTETGAWIINECVDDSRENKIHKLLSYQCKGVKFKQHAPPCDPAAPCHRRSTRNPCRWTRGWMDFLIRAYDFHFVLPMVGLSLVWVEHGENGFVVRVRFRRESRAPAQHPWHILWYGVGGKTARALALPTTKFCPLSNRLVKRYYWTMHCLFIFVCSRSSLTFA